MKKFCKKITICDGKKNYDPESNKYLYALKNHDIKIVCVYIFF